MRSKRAYISEIQPRVDRPCTVDEPTQSRSTLTDPGFASGVTTGDFVYLGMCMEGFLFGTLFVLQMPRPLVNHTNITLSQDSILASSPCIYHIMNRRIPARRKI
jgi:hypothetical protein